jgi:hypothetical protein
MPNLVRALISMGNHRGGNFLGTWFIHFLRDINIKPDNIGNTCMSKTQAKTAGLGGRLMVRVFASDLCFGWVPVKSPIGQKPSKTKAPKSKAP